MRRVDIYPGRAETSGSAFLCSTLEQARDTIPEDKVNIGRFPDDDPVIYEVWT